MKVLIVDDDTINRRLLKYNFESHGCEVVEAKDGQEGLELFTLHNPNVVISDILMPRMDGFQLLNTLKDEKARKPFLFVFSSSVYTNPDEVDFAISLGADGFIIKPKKPAELWDELTAIIRKHQVKESIPPTRVVIEEKEYVIKHSDIVATKLIEKVTELEIAKAKVEESEKKYRDIFENSMEGIFQSTPEGRYITINPALARIFGYDVPQEMIDVTSDMGQQRVNPEDHLRLKGLYEKQDFVEGFETQVYRKDGEKVWISMNTRVVRDPQGCILYYEGTVDDITARKLAEEQLKQSLEKLRRTLTQTASALASALEKRDPYTAGHQQRVALLACMIADEMGFSREQIEGIRVAGVLHDIGKIFVPSDILSKPGKLISFEMSLVQTHADVGYDILKEVEFPWPIAQIVLQHHEKLDGSGYPQGLKGEEILLEARIIAVADVMEAIASHRPYRPAHGIDVAIENIEDHRGTFYDADVVDACLKVFKDGRIKFE
jgi:PAS domain S-box-containing protein/putative nucleotidyltransferase with HDIG domain